MLKIPQKTEYVINTLLSAGFEAYIVGGCVRDMLLKKEPNDFDITTSAEPQEIISLFPKTAVGPPLPGWPDRTTDRSTR